MWVGLEGEKVASLVVGPFALKLAGSDCVKWRIGGKGSARSVCIRTGKDLGFKANIGHGGHAKGCS